MHPCLSCQWSAPVAAELEDNEPDQVEPHLISPLATSSDTTLRLLRQVVIEYGQQGNTLIVRYPDRKRAVSELLKNTDEVQHQRFMDLSTLYKQRFHSKVTRMAVFINRLETVLGSISQTEVGW